MPALAPTLAEVRRRIQRADRKALNEQNTKATLIEPVLRALGWNIEDVDEVQREYKLKTRDKPVDYGLLVLRAPRLFVEAKALGEDLDDRRWASQIMGYASVAGVEWIVLTNGDEYRIYNAHAPVAVEEKLFRTVRVSSDGDPTQQTLELLAKNRMEENRLEVLWRAHYVDRQVRAALEALFSRDNDLLLVNHVASRAKGLTTEEIRASIARCRVHLDFPVQIEEILAKAVGTDPTRRTAREPAAERHPEHVGVTLADLIAAGALKPPVALHREYKGKTLRATIEADGTVKFGSKRHDAPSAAASAARGSVVGGNPATNGWSFWCTTREGNEVELDAIRQRYLKSRAILTPQAPAPRAAKTV